MLCALYGKSKWWREANNIYGKCYVAFFLFFFSFCYFQLAVSICMCVSFINFIHVIPRCEWVWFFYFDFVFILSQILNKIALLLAFLSSLLNILVPSLKIKSLYLFFFCCCHCCSSLSFHSWSNYILFFFLHCIANFILIHAKVDMTFSTVYYRENCYFFKK